MAICLVSALLPISLSASSLSESSRRAPHAPADLTEAKRQFASGEYAECLAQCTEAVEAGIWNEQWYRLKIDVEMTLGKYADAKNTLDLGFEKYASSIQLRWRGYYILRMNGMPVEAQAMLDSVPATVDEYSWRFSDPANRVVHGQCLALLGEDARTILTGYFDKARDLNPRFVPAFQAIAEMALSKHDYAMAAAELQSAIEVEDDNATLHFLLARSFAPSDREKAQAELQRALELNPRHLDALLWSVEIAFDGERYADAENILLQIQEINPKRPELWCYRALMANLRGDFERESTFRERALEPFPTNPDVDHLIGRKLSDKYRFAEGAEYQRRALESDPNHLAAKFQLSQDLLRLGFEEEGWRLADEVNQSDAYNIVAHNLITLRDVIDEFVTLERDGIVVRMSSLEAALYGERVMRLLTRAKEVLGERYEITIDAPIVVEIFPEQKDFAIRTFGLPGGQGFLGVCFGRVITANSPASSGTHLSNWEATLWHEFCHVITLEKTQNRMPRWLSEGISVYEERREGPGWGQTMNSAYRQRIIEGGMTHVRDLSDAFLRPGSAFDLQFAYYQSSLVVQFIVEQHGLEILLNVLNDLAIGMPIDDSLSRYVGSLEVFNSDFDAFARELAGGLASSADWSEANLAPGASIETIEAWLVENPNHLEALRRLALSQLSDQDWEPAAQTLEKIIALYEGQVDRAQDHLLLALAYRELGDLEKEKETLDRLISKVADSNESHQRLIEIGRQQEDWQSVRDNALRLMAIDPLQAMPHQALADASMELGKVDDALFAYTALLRFRASDVAQIHYDMAALYLELQEWQHAKRNILLAIEEAPRFRDAFDLYDRIIDGENAAAVIPVTPSTGEEPTVSRGK